MAAMNADQLTTAVSELQQLVSGINVTLGDIVPKMQQQIIESNALGTTLDAKLKKTVNRLLDADLIPAMTKLSEAQDNLRMMTIDCDKRLVELTKRMEAEAIQSNQRADDMTTVKSHTAEVHNRVTDFIKDLNQAQQTIKDESRKQDMRDTQYQQQMATLSSMVGSSSSGSSTGMRPRSDEPIVVHK